MRPAAALAVGLAALTLVACSTTDDSSTASSTTSVSATAGLALNEVQMIGTHNSYHVAPTPELFAAEKKVADSLGPEAGGLGDISEWTYTHAPLTTQLDRGIRSFELDVWADPVGGLFSEPAAPKLLNVDAPPPDGLDGPGFKVLHIVDVDFGSNCPTFVACLTELRDWSDDHPDHVPIVVNVELKDDPLPAPLDVTEVVTIDGPQLDALDAEIRSVFDEDRLITPDDVRGDGDTLRDAVTTEGWPALNDVRGQVMLFMDNSGRYRDDYLAGHPSLEDRVLFTSSAEETDDDRAVVKVNEPDDGSAIRELVEQGFFIRTRSDSGLAEAETNDTARRQVAFDSGAQIISTDYPPGEPAAGGYVVEFGDGAQVRCNAVLVQRCPRGNLEPN